MMKKTVIGVVLWMMSGGVATFAATGGPDGYGYTWVDSLETNGPAFLFIEPGASASVVIGSTGMVAATATLVHPWSGIYGTNVTQLRVSRNGFITDLLTDPGNDETNDAPLPQPPGSGGGGRIYVLHDALRLDPANGRVTYEYFPESPHPLHACGVHVITWANVYHATGSTNRFSMQALLFDNFDILLQYGAGNPELGSNSTTGIQNRDATIGLQVAANTPNSIPDEYAVRILPPVVVVNTAEDQVDTPAGPAVSLREAIRDAVPGSRIEFAAAYTITLSTNFANRIPLNGRNLAVDGFSNYSTFEGVVISGEDQLRHFRLFNGTHLYLGHLRLIRGYGPSTDLSGSTLVEQGSSLIAFATEWNENRTELDGGAIAVRNSNTVVRLQGGALRMNQAEGQGGAVALRNGATLHMDQVRLIANQADGGGGGLFAQSGTLDVRASEFALNETEANGGGAQFGPGVTGLFFGVTFDDNRALNGGGVSIDNEISVINPPSDLTFRRCTFSENLALVAGGAVYEASENFFGASANPDFFYCTIVRNGAGVRGGGVATVKGQPRFSGVCLALNTAGVNDNNFDTTGTGTAVSLGENLESGTDAGFTGVLDLQNTDPLLSALGYFGGPVRTCMPLAGSPLIDAAVLMNFWTGADARGVGAPPFNGTGASFAFADIGAVEVGPTVWVTSSSASALQAAIDAVSSVGVIRFSNVNVIADAEVNFPDEIMVFIQAEGGPLNFDDAAIRLTNGIHQNVALHGIDLVMGSNGALQVTGGASLSIEKAQIRKVGTGPVFSQTTVLNSDAGRVALNQVEILDGETTRGLWLNFRAQAWVRDSMIRDNELTSSIIFSSSLAELYLQRSSILANRDFSLEAVFLGNGYYVVENTTLSGNEGSDAAASTNRYVVDYSPSVTGSGMFMRNNTVVYNLDRRGVRLNTFPPSRTVFANNIVAFNTGFAIFVETSDGGNLTTWPFFAAATSNDLVNTDPMLYPLSLGRNGTLHHALRPGSPAIDAGVGVFVGRDDGRRGLRYRNGTGVGGPQQDIGAVESGRILTVTTAVDEDNGALGLGAGDSLRECLAAATNFGGAVNIDLGAIGAIELTNALTLSGIQVDLDAWSARTRITRTTGGVISMLNAKDKSMVAVDGARFSGRSLRSEGQSVMTLSRGSITDVQEGSSAVNATVSARLRLSRMHVHDNIRSTLISSTSRGRIDVDRSVLMNNNVQTLIGPVGGRVTVRDSVITRNIATNALVNTFDGQSDMVRSTFFRNSGGTPVSSHAASRYRSTQSIHGNNPVQLDALLARSASYGGNLSDQSPNYFDTDKGDLIFRNPYLAPAFDAELDGVMTLRPLAVSPAFNTRTGAHPPPPQIITVTTTTDENDTPAGAQVSLREAIRDIADGGTILFDPLLNNATLALALNGGVIQLLNKSVVIDATSLPNGIDIVGRLLSLSPGVTLGLHGIHFRDYDAGPVVGGAIAIQNGKLVGSHLAFSGLNSDAIVGGGGAIYLEGGQMVLESVTFSSNAAPSGAAIGLVNATSTVEFTTFAHQQGTAAAVMEGANATVHLHGSVFFTNSRSAFSGVTLVSGGYNAFPGNPSGSIGTDSINNGTLASAYDRFFDYGGWVATYRPTAAATNVMNTLPAVVAGMVPPPLNDARGFIRVADTSADWGAHEFGGGTFDGDGDGLYDWWELAHGFDPDTFTDPDQDLDGDGWSLVEEQGWGTDPFSTNSTPGVNLTIVGTNTFFVLVQWHALPGVTYRVQATTNLVSGQTASAGQITGNGNPLSLMYSIPHITIPPTPQRFYWLRKLTPSGVW